MTLSGSDQFLSCVDVKLSTKISWIFPREKRNENPDLPFFFFFQVISTTYKTTSQLSYRAYWKCQEAKQQEAHSI